MWWWSWELWDQWMTQLELFGDYVFNRRGRGSVTMVAAVVCQTGSLDPWKKLTRWYPILDLKERVRDRREWHRKEKKQLIRSIYGKSGDRISPSFCSLSYQPDNIRLIWLKSQDSRYCLIPFSFAGHIVYFSSCPPLPLVPFLLIESHRRRLL